MDKATYYAEAFSPITGRCFRLSAARMVRPAVRGSFTIAGRTRLRRSNGAGQRRGDPGPDTPE
jgi:hypothetical protein